MKATIVLTEFGALRAVVIVQDDRGKNHSRTVRLRQWEAPAHGGEYYFLLDECPEIPDPEARYAINMALLEHQEYPGA